MKFVVITGRAHCFHDFIFIVFILINTGKNVITIPGEDERYCIWHKLKIKNLIWVFLFCSWLWDCKKVLVAWLVMRQGITCSVLLCLFVWFFSYLFVVCFFVVWYFCFLQDYRVGLSFITITSVGVEKSYIIMGLGRWDWLAFGEIWSLKHARGFQTKNSFVGIFSLCMVRVLARPYLLTLYKFSQSMWISQLRLGLF